MFTFRAYVSLTAVAVFVDGYLSGNVSFPPPPIYRNGWYYWGNLSYTVYSIHFRWIDRSMRVDFRTVFDVLLIHQYKAFVVTTPSA